MKDTGFDKQDLFADRAKRKLTAYIDGHLEYRLQPVVIRQFPLDVEGELIPLQQQLNRFNFALYRFALPKPFDKQQVLDLGRCFGLEEADPNLCADEDRLSRITVKSRQGARHYIPYTDRKIGWHTDGYYNPYHQRVKSFILHCVQPAASGGVNTLLDQDMAYYYLHQQNPEFIKALSHPEVMCIPENVVDGICLREQTCSPVFDWDDLNPVLTMRYSRRQSNIIWRDEVLVREALGCLNEFLDSDNPYIIQKSLKSGEGVITNNVLHGRTAFGDDPEHPRVFYRARYYMSIPTTEPTGE